MNLFKLVEKSFANFPTPFNSHHAPYETIDRMEDTSNTPISQPDAVQRASTQLRNESPLSKSLILPVFTCLGQAYFDQLEAIKMDISLKKVYNTNILEDVTEADKIGLDIETSVGKDMLDNIIRTEVNSKTKKLNSELEQLKK